MRFISPTILRTLLLGALGLPNQACSGSTVDNSKGRSEEGTGGGGGGADGTGGAVDPGTGGTVNPGTGGQVPHDAHVPFPNACTNPVPVIAGADTGIFKCQEGYLHRAEARQCPSRLPRDGIVPLPAPPAAGGSTGAGGTAGAAGSAGAGTGGTAGADAGPAPGVDAGPAPSVDAGGPPPDECLQDSDCPTNAMCVATSNWSQGPCIFPGPPQEIYHWRMCFQGCRVDADCAADQLCLCGDDIGTCVSKSYDAGCRTDADCNGGQCISNGKTSQYSPGLFACQLPGDTCNTDEECGGWSSNSFCLIGSTGRTCRAGSVCGRPFLVERSQRLAPAMRSDAWLELSNLDGLEVPLDPTLARRLAEHWTEIGLMEHASVAAFARFTLQLLALGAPAELVRESTAAQADEMRHATLAFELATSYGDAPVGPGPLDLSGALESQSLEEILRTTIQEGCVGETRAALEAAEAARLTTVPSVKAALEGIARDEGRHAALAWRVVRWLLAEHPELEQVARDEFRRASRPNVVAGFSDAAGLAHGMLDGATLARVHRAASDEVISPCAEALFEVRRAA
jgi:hypothetical protein